MVETRGVVGWVWAVVALFFVQIPAVWADSRLDRFEEAFAKRYEGFKKACFYQNKYTRYLNRAKGDPSGDRIDCDVEAKTLELEAENAVHALHCPNQNAIENPCPVSDKGVMTENTEELLSSIGGQAEKGQEPQLSGQACFSSPHDAQISCRVRAHFQEWEKWLQDQVNARNQRRKTSEKAGVLYVGAKSISSYKNLTADHMAAAGDLAECFPKPSRLKDFCADPSQMKAAVDKTGYNKPTTPDSTQFEKGARPYVGLVILGAWQQDVHETVWDKDGPASGRPPLKDHHYPNEFLRVRIDNTVCWVEKAKVVKLVSVSRELQVNEKQYYDELYSFLKGDLGKTYLDPKTLGTKTPVYLETSQDPILWQCSEVSLLECLHFFGFLPQSEFSRITKNYGDLLSDSKKLLDRFEKQEKNEINPAEALTALERLFDKSSPYSKHMRENLNDSERNKLVFDRLRYNSFIAKKIIDAYTTKVITAKTKDQGIVQLEPLAAKVEIASRTLGNYRLTADEIAKTEGKLAPARVDREGPDPRTALELSQKIKNSIKEVQDGRVHPESLAAPGFERQIIQAEVAIWEKASKSEKEANAELIALYKGYLSSRLESKQRKILEKIRVILHSDESGSLGAAITALENPSKPVIRDEKK